MYFELICKNCGKKFKVEDLDFYPEDGHEKYPYAMSAKQHLCGDCVHEYIDQNLINLVSRILDKCESENQLEDIIDLIEKLSIDNYDATRLKELIESHFGGYDNLRAWGLW